ncbi:MAG: hypothetical protein LCH99_34515, partial [Proteobacteria bacterium]|nr:hypothetical protein [Pseudomonadota bacterium]
HIPAKGGGIISEQGGDYFSEWRGEIISESGGGLPRNLHDNELGAEAISEVLAGRERMRPFNRTEVGMD